MRKYNLFPIVIVIFFGCSKNKEHVSTLTSSEGRGIVGATLAKTKVDSLDYSLYPDSLRSFLVSANALRDIYVSSHPEDDSATQNLFFTAFPSTFCAFEIIYGNVLFEKGLPNMLALESEAHVSYLFSLRYIGKFKFLEKIVGIAAHGKWDTDGVSVFSHHLNRYLENNVDSEILTVLDRLSSSDVTTFFYFLLDGPHPEHRYHERLARIIGGNKRILRCAGLALEEIKGRASH